MNEHDILKNVGKISAELAREIAETAYSQFEINRRQIAVDQADDEIKNAVRKLVEGKKRGGNHEAVE